MIAVYDKRLTGLLISPSLLSGSAAVFIVLGILGYNAWLYISENQIFYDYLFGKHGINTYIWQHSLWASSWKNALLSSPLAYYALVGGVAIAAGLVVYVALQWFNLFFKGSSKLWSELHAPDREHKQIVSDLLTRLALRVVTLLGWSVYSAFFFSTLLPFVFVLYRISIDHISAAEHLWWLGGVAAALILILALHVHVVFARLIFLRPRLFGGDRVIAEAEAQAEHTVA